MKSSSVVLAVLILAFFPISAAQARSLEEINRTGEIRIGISPIHPSVCRAAPQGCRTDCQITGPAYEIALAFAATLGPNIKPRFLRIDWDEQFFNKDGKTIREDAYTPELLGSGRVDLYPNNLSVNEWRRKKMDIVTLFPSRRMVIVNRSRKEAIKMPSDLAGKVAATEKDTSYHTWLQEQNQGAFASHPIVIRLMGTDECLKAVEKGEVDFTMIDSDAAIWAVRQEYKNLDMAFPVGTTDENGWGLRKQDKDLQETVRRFFREQRADDQSALNLIWRKYYGMSLTQFIRLVGAMME
ncbi:MAG: transporter substrate-binding domain-containing protein [Deltaproteobacteria bacterium]|nr:transporter substrate-binding domain-containing protein [Deltaproteobacteria bacterium]